MVESLRLGF